MPSMLFFTRPWAAGGSITPISTEVATLPVSALEDAHRHHFGREATGATGTGFAFTFDASVNLAGLVLLDYSVDASTASIPAVNLKLDDADPFVAAAYETGNSPLRAKDLWPDTLHWSSNPVREWSWLIPVDTVQAGKADGSSGSPATQATLTGQLTFETVAGPSGYHQASMLVALVDPVEITATGSVGSPERSGRDHNRELMGGYAKERTVRWHNVPNVVADSLDQAYLRASGGPLFVLPDTSAAKPAASPFAFSDGTASDQRGGYWVFTRPPDRKRLKDGQDLWSVTCEFSDYGLV